MSGKKLLFISHAEKDSQIAEAFVDLLYDMGVAETSMFCSSIAELGVPIKEDIYEYLRNLLDSEQVIPIFLLSDNYYSSVACLNEMGAVWIKQKDYFMFLLPEFEFSEIKGAISPRKRGVLLWYRSDREEQNLKENLNQFREELCKLLNIKRRRNWEKKRDDFVKRIQGIKEETEVVDIGLGGSEGYCIGESGNDGCEVHFDQATNKIVSQIDFTKTKAELCSVVIFTLDIDLCKQYKAGRSLEFDLKASDTISSVEVECRLKNRDVRIKLATSQDWERYSIPLTRFGGDALEWKSLSEIKFLLKRKDTSGGKVEIKNVRII